MLADYYTKPLMGTKFQEFRNYVMGWKSITDLVMDIDHSGEIKERVGNKIKMTSEQSLTQKE